MKPKLFKREAGKERGLSVSLCSKLSCTQGICLACQKLVLGQKVDWKYVLILRFIWVKLVSVLLQRTPFLPSKWLWINYFTLLGGNLSTSSFPHVEKNGDGKRQQILIIFWSGKKWVQAVWLLLGNHIKLEKCLSEMLQNTMVFKSLKGCWCNILK